MRRQNYYLISVSTREKKFINIPKIFPFREVILQTAIKQYLDKNHDFMDELSNECIGGILIASNFY